MIRTAPCIDDLLSETEERHLPVLAVHIELFSFWREIVRKLPEEARFYYPFVRSAASVKQCVHNFRGFVCQPICLSDP